MIYLAPNNSAIGKDGFGLLISLNSQRELLGREWAMDNGRFGKHGVNKQWTDEKWKAMLEKYQGDVGSCKFCVVPDVPYDAAGTLALFPKYAPIVKSYGYPLAFCTQDGMQIDDIPWADIDALFVGGSDAHKLGREAAILLVEAKRRGKWTHIGRVNSDRRIRQFWYVDSVDGTTLARNSSPRNVSNLSNAVSFCRAKKRTRKLI